MRWSQKVFGPQTLGFFLRPTFYRQFVGGDTESELRHTSNNLQEAGLRLMVCPVQEEDVGETEDVHLNE